LNTLRGPGFANLDLSVQRMFTVRNRWSLQARAEVFNLTNTPHFDIPSATNRNVSNLQLNADGTIRNLGGFIDYQHRQQRPRWYRRTRRPRRAAVGFVTQRRKNNGEDPSGSSPGIDPTAVVT